MTPDSEAFEPGLYGAFLNVYVACKTEVEFREKASQAVTDERCEILEITDVMPFDINDNSLDAEEIGWLREQFDEGHQVAFGVFHTFPEDGLDG